ncbi:hypothetical protein JOM56_014448 [Amanita muscaria]
MAVRTQKAKYETGDDSVSHTQAILCHAKNVKEIYYQLSAAPTAAPIIPSGPIASIEDVPIKAIDILSVIVAQKLKKKVDEIPLSKTIKDLVGGKSTLQNEILGDLQQEFSTAPEKAEELPLEELGSTLGAGSSGSLGKYSNGLIARLIGGKMPGGFNISAIKSYLAKTWGLGSLMVEYYQSIFQTCGSRGSALTGIKTGCRSAG